MAKNLFEKKTNAKPKAAKKDDKINIVIDNKEFSEKLKKFATLKSQIDELTAELAMSKDFVKDVAVEEYSKLFETRMANVGSFNLSSVDGGSVMVVPTKKYLNIDETASELLKTTYGENIVTENTTYGFNPDVLMRNMEIISELIMNSSISDEDKENLITQSTTYSVEKDSLDKIYVLSKETKLGVKEILQDLQPVITLKNAK